jgi:hypothetical protein
MVGSNFDNCLASGDRAARLLAEAWGWPALG